MGLAWKDYDEKKQAEVMSFCDDYMAFLSEAKTERRFVQLAIEKAEAAGYRNIEEIIQKKEPLHPQEKVYMNQMNKAVALMQIGDDPLEDGMNILGAHIDSPRLDLKQHPLYEEGDLAYFDTHYYGGVKKYQWVTIPLAIYGVVVLKNGQTIDVAIGDKEEDPVFVISDLLIHLASKQMNKKADQVVEGESLNVTIGSIPLADGKEDPVKAHILQILKTNYGFEEEDFISAELEVVPAGKARSCGLDKSLILAYGQDDKVCAYSSLRAMLEDRHLQRTAACLLVDKEEVGSQGATGMQSQFFEIGRAHV